MKKILITKASQIVTPIGRSGRPGQGMNDLTIIEDGCVLIQDGKILKVCKTSEIDENWLHGADIIDASGKIVLPGLIDAHTHLVFAGTREDEFSLRMAGESYLTIMEKGGGIQRSIDATRLASEKELYDLARKRVINMAKMGVTTVEAKSGYGGTLEDEIKQCKVARKLNESGPISVVSTLMAAHTVVREYRNDPEKYVKLIIEEIIPRVAREKLAEFCDVFLEKSAFNYAQAERVLTAAKANGFELKIHADEITNGKGAHLAAKLNAISAEHLLFSDREGLEAMRKHHVTAVLLPLTAFSLREPYAKARDMIKNGLVVALASDFNPGSCYTYSMPMLMAVACLSMHMSIEEVITALTLNAAAAINRAHKIGSIETGKDADIAIFSCPNYAHLVYHMGINQAHTVIRKGEVIVRNGEIV
ncbi:MAG: imidazolonepropionase [Erysipelotrichaceae bacterium]|nr:imidazolonepropionase [Erysipelotrichaceae bacterium]